jgi:hypothetical protein
MRRERALKIVLVVVGLLFTAGLVPLTMFFSREPSVRVFGTSRLVISSRGRRWSDHRPLVVDVSTC